MLKVWKKMAWYISLKHLLKFAGQKNYNCVTLKKKSQLCHKHNCENNSCVVSMVCESMIHPLHLARGNCCVERLELGTGLQHVRISNEWWDKPEVPSEVFRTVLRKNLIIISYSTSIARSLQNNGKSIKIKTLSKIGG